MENNLIKHISFSLLVVFFQIVVFNNLEISSFVIPFAYPIIIVSFARTTSRSLILILGFLIGLVIDVFSNTGGAHAMGLTAMAFFQPYLLSSMGPSDSGSEKASASIYSLGIQNYFVFALILLFLHHFIVFTMEVFSFTNFGATFLRIISSSIASAFLLMLIQFTFVRKAK